MSLTLWGFVKLLLVHGQKCIVYPSGFEPHPREVPQPSFYGIPHELLELQTPDKVTIHCHQMLFSQFQESNHQAVKSVDANIPTNGRATVIMFHGNAMNHGEMIDLALEFLSLGCNVLTVSYRGYGNSTGTPSESGLRKDSQTVLNHVIQHEVLSSVPIVAYGQSLGGAVAIDLVYSNPTKVSALIIENTFMSIPLLVKDFPQPLGSLSFLCTQRWPSIDRIQHIPRKVPILMLGGDEDQVVPPKHLQGLWAAAAGRRGVGGGRKGRGRSRDTSVGQRDESDGRKSVSDEDTETDGGHDAGCFPYPFASSGHILSSSEVLKTLDVVTGSKEIKNGRDTFKLFAKRRHETTCHDSGYWPTIRTFLNDISQNTAATTGLARPSPTYAPSLALELPAGSLLTTVGSNISIDTATNVADITITTTATTATTPTTTS